VSPVIGSVRAEPSPVAGRPARAVKSAMVSAANMVEVAALVGDTARSTMLGALMGGQALTGSVWSSATGVQESAIKIVVSELISDC
jgi:hypothetical protein